VASAGLGGLKILAVALGAAGLFAQTRGWQASPEAIAAAAKAQSGFNYDEANAGQLVLPDPLARSSGRVGRQAGPTPSASPPSRKTGRPWTAARRCSALASRAGLTAARISSS
jgi:hypothetical protein